MADPFADLIPKGGSEQGGGTPALATTFGYNDPEDNGVGAWGDVTNRPDVQGVSLPIPVLKQQFGDINKAHGQLVKVTNPDTGKSIVAPIVDKGPADWVVARQGNTIDLTHATNTAIGGTGKTPVTYSFVGKKEEQDPFADLIPQAQATNAPSQQQAQEQTADPFSDLIPKQQGQTQANTSFASPTAQNAPAQNELEPAKPTTEIPWYKNLAGSTAAQTAASFIRQLEGLERAGAAPVVDISGVNAPFHRGATIQEATSSFDKAIADKQASLDSIQSIVKKQGFSTAEYTNQINDLQQQIGDLQAQKDATLQRQEYSPEAQQQLTQERQQLGQEASSLEQQAQGMFPYFGVNPTDTAISAQLGRGLGNVAAIAPAMIAGPVALPVMAVQGGSQAYAEGYNAKTEELKQKGVTDQAEIEKESHKAGSESAVQSIPSLAAYMVGGALTTKATSALLKGASPVVKGLVGGAAAAGVNLGVSGGLRAAHGGNVIPSIEEAVPDIMFGGIHGAGAYFEARAKAKAKMDIAAGGTEPTLAPSSNAVVNERELKINAMADEQAPVPEAPITPEPISPTKSPAADLNALLAEQLFHDEGSAKWNEIQAQIDQLKVGEATAPAEVTTEEPPAEAPAEAQPTTENAVQIASATQTMLRPQVTGQGEVVELPRVGEQNAQVPAEEAQAPKEEVKSTLPEQTQSDFIDFAQKTGKLNKTQAKKALSEYEKAGVIKVGEDGEMLFTKPENATREALRKAAGIEEAAPASPSQPIRDVLRRFQSGEEDAIETLQGLRDSVSDAANKTKNKTLSDLAVEIQDAIDHGVEIGDAEELVNRTLSRLESEANRIEAPKEKKTSAEKVKTRKDKAREVFGDAAEGLSYVLENKILDPIEYKKRVKAGIIQGGGEYDFFYNHKFPKKVRDLIFSRTGRPIDIVSDDAGFKNPHDLLVAIDEAHRTAEASKEQAAEMEKRQKALEENIHKMAELEKTNPEAHAAEVESDVRKFIQGRMRGEGGYFTLPEVIYDAAVSVGRSVAKGARDFKSWSGEMVNRLGEGIRNHLRQIWNSVKENWNKDIGGGFDTGGRSREQAQREAEAKYAPKPPTEQEAFAKKAADAFLKGRGTPITEEEMSSILARKFPGISQGAVSDLFATASGKPKAAGYAGVFAEPSQQGTMPEQRTTGLKKAVVKQERLSRGLEDIPQQERQSETERVQRAVDRVQSDSSVAPSIVARIVDFKEPNISVDDAAALLVERNRLMNDRQNWENILDDEGKSPAERNNAQLQLDSIEEQLNRLDEAQRATGSEWGRLGRMYQRMIAEDYSLESMERKERRNLGRPLERQEREKLKKEAESIQKTSEELQAAQEKAQTEQEKVAVAETYWKTIQELKAELASRPKIEPQMQRIIDRIGKTIKSQADQARERIRQRRSEGRFMSGLDPTDIADHAIIGADYIYEGATDLAKFTTRMVKELGEYVRPYIKQIFAASQKQYDATTDRVAGNKAEKVRETTPKPEQSIAKIKATGKAEKTANPFLPTLEHLEDPLTHKLVYELARQHILEGVKGEDNVMKAVHNDIKDVYPDATERDVRRAFSEYGKAKFPSKEADRIALAELRTLTRLQESIDRLTEGLPALKSGLQRNKNTQLIREKQAKLNELLKKVKLPPTEEELASRDAAKQTALRNRIADLDKQLRTGERLKRTPTEPDSPETENLRLEKNAMEQLLKEIEGEAKPKKTPEEAYNERRQKAIRKKMAEIEERIKNNRYEKAPKRIPPTKNTDTQRLELELKKKQNEFDRRQLQYQEERKPRWQKLLQETSELAKGMAITGYHSLEKILGFDIAKLISTPIEEFTGSAVSKLTGIKPKEGSLEVGGGTIQGLLRYYKGLVKGAIEAPKVLKTGLSESEELFGKVRPNVARWYDFIGGRLHASLKHIPFTAQEELYRYRGLANAEKAVPGSTKSDLVKMAIYKVAYEKAQSAKLQEANKVAEAINGYFTRLEQIDPKTGKSSVAGNVVSTLVKTFITKGIIKTPANYFKQVMRGIIGLPEGAGRVVRAYWNGIENLTPEETDAIYKAFKVGGIGFAAGLYGYIDSFKDKKDRKFGGYYQAGRKTGDGDAKWGTIRIGDHTFHYIAHNPVTEIMQFGSTVGRVQQALMKKTDMPTAIATGFGKSLIALLGNAPVSGPLMRLGQPYSDPIGEISRGLVPALISNIAQDTKGEAKYAPTNPAQQIMANIPGLQKYVPTAKPKKSSSSDLGKGLGGFGKGL